MKFDHPEYEASFELSDKWTVREALAYDSETEASPHGTYIRLWDAVRAVIDPEKWHCEVPLDLSLDDAPDEKTLDIIKWAGLAGYSARQAMNADEKN